MIDNLSWLGRPMLMAACRAPVLFWREPTDARGEPFSRGRDQGRAEGEPRWLANERRRKSPFPRARRRDASTVIPDS